MKKLTPTHAILGGAVLGLAAAYLKNNSTQEIQDHSVGSVSDIQDPIINTCVHVTFPTNENTPIYKPYYTVIINYKQLYVAP